MPRIDIDPSLLPVDNVSDIIKKIDNDRVIRGKLTEGCELEAHSPFNDQSEFVTLSKENDFDDKISCFSGMHPLILAAHMAFAYHLPLVLTPDAVWVTFLQGVAQHLNHHVPNTGRRDGVNIDVSSDFLRKGGKDNPWDEVVHCFRDKMQSHMTNTRPQLTRAMDLSFTTSTSVTRAAADMCFMEAMKNEFSYSVTTLCGIPRVHLKGTREDWDAMARTAFSVLTELDMSAWKARLVPTLAQITDSFDDTNKDHGTFWGQIYKLRGAEESGDVTRVTGWLSHLFPYTRANKPTSLMEGIKPFHFPSGFTHTPFVWNYINDRYDMRFAAGFLGVARTRSSYDDENGIEAFSVEPILGWIVGHVAEYKPISSGRLGSCFVHDSSKIDQVTREFFDTVEKDGTKIAEYPQFLTALNSGLGAKHTIPNNSISLDAFKAAKAKHVALQKQIQDGSKKK
jgi:hypothetical protein